MMMWMLLMRLLRLLRTGQICGSAILAHQCGFATRCGSHLVRCWSVCRAVLHLTQQGTASATAALGLTGDKQGVCLLGADVARVGVIV